jgi:hypothetical protein
VHVIFVSVDDVSVDVSVDDVSVDDVSVDVSVDDVSVDDVSVDDLLFLMSGLCACFHWER